MSVNWHPERFIKRVEAKLSANLDRAAIMLVRDIKKSMYGRGPAEVGMLLPWRKRPIGWRPWYFGNTAALLKHKLQPGERYLPSAPWETPGIQMGTLKRSIRWERISAYTRRIGSTLRGDPHSYALYLELGTSRMLPRPYLLPAVRRNAERIRRIIAGVAA
jgi:hypothetical protein